MTAIVGRLSPAKVVKGFFDGMGEAYAGVIGIIIAAGVFIGGLNAIGSIDRMIEALKDAQSAAPVVAMLGTFGIAVLSGPATRPRSRSTRRCCRTRGSSA